MLKVGQKCRQLASNSDQVLVLKPFDIRDYSKHQTSLSSIIEKFGKLDIMVNNIGRTQRAAFQEIDDRTDRDIFDINVFGQIALSRVVLKYFYENKKDGHFVVTSSVAGKFGAPNSASYTGSKHALIGYFETLRSEAFSRGVNVTIVCPGESVF